MGPGAEVIDLTEESDVYPTIKKQARRQQFDGRWERQSITSREMRDKLGSGEGREKARNSGRDFKEDVRSKENAAERLSLEDRMDAVEWEINTLKSEKLPGLEAQISQLQAKIRTIEAEKPASRKKIEAEQTNLANWFSYAYFAESRKKPVIRKSQASSLFFRQLPAEVRHMIWNFARPDPRVVKIQQANNTNSGFGFYSHMPVPSLLHLCAESRQVALKWYTRNVTKNDLSVFDRMFVDWSFDFVFIGNCALCQAQKGTCFLRSRRERWASPCESYPPREYTKRCGKVVLEVTTIQHALYYSRILQDCKEVFLVQPSQLLPRWGIGLSDLREINIQQPPDHSGSLLKYYRNMIVEAETFSDSEDDQPPVSLLEKIAWVEYTGRNTQSG